MPAVPPPIGRNEPCPCGSGKKYKKCCMGKGLPAAAVHRTTTTSAGELRRRAAAARDRGRAGDARKLYGEAVSADPQDAAAHVGLAELLFENREVEAALGSAERAVAIDPGVRGGQRARARCLEYMNRLDEARQAIDSALEQLPNDPQSALIAARIARRGGDCQVARRRLETLVAGHSIPLHVRHEALTELGFALDRLGEYDAAYEAFHQAGEHWSRTPGFQAVDKDLAPARVREYRAGLHGELLGRWSDAVEHADEPAPAFLVGFPRSGTTMTEQILAAHPDIVTTDEEPLIGAVGQALMQAAPRGSTVMQAIERLELDDVIRLRQRYWQRARQVLGGDPGGRIMVDKLPLNIIEIGLINVVFPDAKVIVALRDPRDVCLSCFMQYFAPNPAMVQLHCLESTVRFYSEVMGLWLHLRDMTTLSFAEVRYEDTVTDLESQGRRVLELLELPWHEQLLQFHEQARDRVIRTPSYAAVTEKVHTRAIGRWRNYQAQFAPHQQTLQPLLDAFGYDAAAPRRGKD